MGSRRRAKATIRTHAAVLCPQYGTQTGRIHKGGQDCREEQPGIPCSPINALQGHEMHPGARGPLLGEILYALAEINFEITKSEAC